MSYPLINREETILNSLKNKFLCSHFSYYFTKTDFKYVEIIDFMIIGGLIVVTLEEYSKEQFNVSWDAVKVSAIAEITEEIILNKQAFIAEII